MTEKKQANGFFPWKVEQLLSVVPDLLQQNDRQPDRRPLPPASNMTNLIHPKPRYDPEPELVDESRVSVIGLPTEAKREAEMEEDWELLSERVSCRSRSIGHESTSHTTLSLPFKLQRTNSSSTIDSQDNALGPSGKGILGVDYVEHIVLPTDTLQGVCLAYKVSASHLRRANHFSGNSLHSAPRKLLIPLSKQALRTGFIRVQDTASKEYKLSFFQAEFPDIAATEAKA